MLGIGTILWIGIVGSLALVAFCGNNGFWEKDWYQDEEEA